MYLTALGLCSCAWAFSSCSELGLLFVTVHRLLAATASLVVEHRLQSPRASVIVACGLSTCSFRL